MIAKLIKTLARAGRERYRNMKAGLQSRRALHRLQKRSGFAVHLGCGRDVKTGWVNLDMEYRHERGVATSEQTYYIRYDLCSKLPFAEGSCRMIYSSHFFEHLAYQDGLRLMRDCHQALEPGGVFRLALPDLRKIFIKYLEQDWQYFDLIPLLDVLPDVEPGTETLVDYVNYAVYQSGEHRCIYDEEKIIKILTTIGYRSVVSSRFSADIDLDTPERRRYSFYMEATK